MRQPPCRFPEALLAKRPSSGILLAVSRDRTAIKVQLRIPWVLAVMAVPLILQFVIPSRTWVAVFCCLGGAVLLGYFWARQLAEGLTLTREQHYGWIHVGDVLEEHFTLRNAGLLPALWVEIDDQSDLPGYSARSVRSVGSQQILHWRTQGTCRQRGLFTLGPWQVQTGDPLGFFRVFLSFPETQTLLIYPQVVHLPTLRLPRGAATGTGRTSQRALEVTTNAAGVRAYVPGDSINRIHWRTSAHRDTLMAMTFDLEPSGDLWIVLDLDAAVQAGQGEESTEEYGVILASSLADRVLNQNRAVGLVVYGTNEPQRNNLERQPRPIIVQPEKGKAHQWRILQALATVHAGGHWPLERVLAETDRNLGRGMTLAVITPSLDPAWLGSLLPPMRRGVAPTVLLLDAESFNGKRDRDPGPDPVDIMAGLLADLGVPSHRIAKGMPFRQIVEHKRIGPPEYRVLPGTGRVIVVDG
jgi:uncharacterized protein (DUF58 family)